MKLIIDISEEEYKEVLEDTYSGTPYENKIFTLIANGTPLPKGHGDLVDRDAVYKAYDYSDIEYTMLNALEDATVIIEADMESKE